MGLSFILEGEDAGGRAGTMVLDRGRVATPCFMPVATQGAVKAAGHDDVEALGFRLLICNAYHLAVRPGVEAIGRRGGLHRFMGWPHLLATDSGGFQVMSLAQFRKVTDGGVAFRSPLDGVLREFTPESVVAMQETFGSDMMMPLDECPPAGAPPAAAEQAVARTSRWAARAVAERARGAGGGALFGIVQGSTDPVLRRRSAGEITALPFDAFAIGGLSVGEPRPAMLEALGVTAPLLPAARPRYLMGVGEPGDVVDAVAAGIDLFDCVFPTRVARNGLALTRAGRVVVRNADAAEEDGPLDPGCACPACARHSRAYLRHLLHANELAGLRLLTIHNLAYMRDLMAGMRAAILAGRFAAFARDALALWRGPAGAAGTEAMA